MSRSLDNAIHALNTLAKIARIGDRDLGEMLEASRQTAYAKRHGEVRLSLDDIDMLAAGLGVPPIVFLYDHQELMRWIGEANWRGPKVTADQPRPVLDWNAVEQLDLFSSEPLAADVRAGGVLWEFSDRTSVDTLTNVVSEVSSRERQLVA